MATIYQVSELAGVSLATVSRVMNNSDKVSDKTREKVLAAMEELGYRPNFIAQSLASNRSNSVGILIPELFGPYFSVMLSSIEEELRNAGKHVIITAGHSDEQRERESIDFLLTRQVDALILHVYGMSDEQVMEVARGAVPVVLLTRELPGIENRCVTLDNEKGGYLAAHTLLELGHRHIAYISGPLTKADANERLAGHNRALGEFGLSVDDQLIFEGDYQEGSGRLGMAELLGRGAPFSAVVCANDEMAAGAMAVARNQGFDIPGDVSIIGFDDVFFTRYLHPKLSSIAYPIDGMGRMAARIVLQDVFNMEDLRIRRHFEPTVARRDSIGPPSAEF
jgi:LacI family transcriptional regulator